MKKILQSVVGKIANLQEIRKEYKNRKSKKGKSAKSLASDTKEPQAVHIEIQAATVIKVLLIFSVFLFLKNIFIELQSILIITSVCLFLAIGLSPILDRIEQFKIPRPLAILILYVIFLGILGILFVKLIPIIAEQLEDIARDLGVFILDGNLKKIPGLHGFLGLVNFDAQEAQGFLSQNISSIAENLKNIAGSTFGILSGVFQGVFNFIFALVLLFFILMEREMIGRFFLLLFPTKNQKYIQNKFIAVQTKMAEWFRGQFILMLCMGGFMYMGMRIFEIFFDMKYAATIGLVAGIMEIFPYLGVFIVGLLCVLVAINISWYLVLAVLVWMAVAQFLEGNFLVPLVMEKVTGLSSVVVILAVAIGGILGGAIGGAPMVILGMIFAVPVMASIAIFVQEYANRENL